MFISNALITFDILKITAFNDESFNEDFTENILFSVKSQNNNIEISFNDYF